LSLRGEFGRHEFGPQELRKGSVTHSFGQAASAIAAMCVTTNRMDRPELGRIGQSTLTISPDRFESSDHLSGFSLTFAGRSVIYLWKLRIISALCFSIGILFYSVELSSRELCFPAGSVLVT
jgi:hypothetical protein